MGVGERKKENREGVVGMLTVSMTDSCQIMSLQFANPKHTHTQTNMVTKSEALRETFKPVFS